MPGTPGHGALPDHVPDVRDGARPTHVTPIPPAISSPSPDQGVPQAPESFVSVRQAVILLMAVVIGLVIGGLAYAAYGNLAGAVIAGLGAAGGTVLAAHLLVR